LNFLITGITGLRNCGVDALLTTVVAGLRRRWPECRIDVLTYDLPFDSRRGYDVEFHANKFRDFFGRPMHRIARQLLPRQRNDAADMQRLIARANVVIASGGDVFSSDYASLGRHLMPLAVARQCSVPYFFLGHSIGRFRTGTDAENWLGCARNALGVTVRESASYQYVVEELRLDSIRVEQTADTAFLLDPGPSDHVESLRRLYGLQSNHPCIACSISRGITRFAGENVERHLETWRRLIEHILSDADHRVLLIPHVQERSTENDDRLLATRLMRRLGFPDRVTLAAADHTAAEYKALISACDFLIAERMHAAIAGFSTMVPTLAVGYSIKAEGIVEDVYGPSEDLPQVLVDLKTFLDPQQAVALFDQAWSRREALASRLAERRATVLAAAERNFGVLAELLPTGR
jgi:colanic acid/amylovoran biosynthesis protein